MECMGVDGRCPRRGPGCLCCGATLAEGWVEGQRCPFAIVGAARAAAAGVKVPALEKHAIFPPPINHTKIDTPMGPMEVRPTMLETLFLVVWRIRM